MKQIAQLQAPYWDGLSAWYQRVMKISVEDFHYGPQIPGDSILKILPEKVGGLRCLELGSGAAQNSVFLAKRGAICTAIDISAEQLRFARALAKRENVKISFHRAGMDTWRGKGEYDLIHSSHALEFVDDPKRVVRRAAELLAPGGMLIVSTVHPLFNGDWLEDDDDPGVFLRSYFQPPDDERRHGGKVAVVSRAYPIYKWFAWFRAAELEVTRLEEPQAIMDGFVPYTSKSWAENDGWLSAVPGTLILAGIKKERDAPSNFLTD